MNENLALKRLRMRSWRRGIREIDLILGTFADGELAELNTDERRLYDEMLSENDHDLYLWLSRQQPPPDQFAAMIDRVAAHMDERIRGANTEPL